MDMIASEPTAAEELLSRAVETLVVGVEAAGAIVVFVGALVAFLRWVPAALARRPERFLAVRLDLGRYVVVGLELQLAADVLQTAVAPSFEAIGRLAAIAAVRTVLNIVLTRETARERDELVEAGERPPGEVAA